MVNRSLKKNILGNNLLFGILTFTLLTVTCFTQNLPLGKITVEDGLSNSYVNCLLQDSFGFIWFGTDDGLNRFDGYDIKVYRNVSDDSTSLSDNVIWSLFEDRDRFLWIGTKTGKLNRYDPYNDRFENWFLPYNDNEEKSITYITQDKNKLIWIGTYRNGIYRFNPSLNKFDHWQNVGIPDTSVDFNRLFLGVAVSSWDAGWLAGDNGKIYATADYGDTWLPRVSGTDKDLCDIVFKNPSEGVVAGRNGTVKFTTDAGLTWHEDSYLSSLTTKDILSISEVDSNTASAITVNNYNGDSQGSGTTFFLAVSSEPFVGIKNDNNVTPSEFKLEQNYPNPFNPSTTIEFLIPQTSIVHLDEYNVLGEQVTTLLNEERPAGNQSVQFNASNLPSGIYFYSIKAGSYYDSKKWSI